jgi:hypothetical protein
MNSATSVAAKVSARGETKASVIAKSKEEFLARPSAAVDRRVSSFGNPLLQEPRLPGGGAKVVGGGASATKVEIGVHKVEKSSSLENVARKELLPKEGNAGTYGELKKLSVKDGLDAHHGPNDQYMQKYGISKDEGIAILVRNELHREIHKKMQIQDPTLSSRDALAQSVLRTREVYKANDLYLPEMRQGLQDKIELSKKIHPNIFKK